MRSHTHKFLLTTRLCDNAGGCNSPLYSVLGSMLLQEWAGNPPPIASPQHNATPNPSHIPPKSSQMPPQSSLTMFTRITPPPPPRRRRWHSQVLYNLHVYYSKPLTFSSATPWRVTWAQRSDVVRLFLRCALTCHVCTGIITGTRRFVTSRQALVCLSRL
jgi:hypothetical protein